jgi:hypothetical protein
MEHFGRNPVSIQENAAFPCLMDDGSGFYFSRDNQIFRGEFVPVSLDELRTLLQAVTPNYARKISIKIPTLQETEQLKNSLEMVHNEYEIFQAGLIFYEAKLLEELNLLELAQQTYKKVANYPSCDVYQEATEAALEKLEILMNREQK